MIRICQRWREDGFTLIEVLIAIGIVGISLLSILPIILVAATQVSQSKYRSIAVQLAQSQIEKIAHLNYEQVSDDFETESIESNGMVFERSADVDEGANASTYEPGDERVETGLKLITVRVSWVVPGGQMGSRYVEASTLLYIQ